MPVKRYKYPYIVLVTMLIIAVVGTVLILAHGLDRDQFFVTLSIDQCSLPFAFAFLIYIGLEWLSIKRGKDKEEHLLVYAKNSSEKAVKITFFVTLASLVASLVLFFAFHNNEQYIAGASLMAISFFPGMSVYLWMHIASYLRKEEIGKPLWILFLYFLALLVVTGLAAGGGYFAGDYFYFFYAAIPLLCIIFALAGRSAE